MSTQGNENDSKEQISNQAMKQSESGTEGGVSLRGYLRHRENIAAVQSSQKYRHTSPFSSMGKYFDERCRAKRSWLSWPLGSKLRTRSHTRAFWCTSGREARVIGRDPCPGYF